MPESFESHETPDTLEVNLNMAIEDAEQSISEIKSDIEEARRELAQEEEDLTLYQREDAEMVRLGEVLKNEKLLSAFVQHIERQKVHIEALERIAQSLEAGLNRLIMMRDAYLEERHRKR